MLSCWSCILLFIHPKNNQKLAAQDAAGQLRKSPYQFTGIGPTSPLLWLAKGWAVLEGPAIPIVAEGDEEPNDTYLQQLGDSARAAVEVRKTSPQVLLPSLMINHSGCSITTLSAAVVLLEAHSHAACSTQMRLAEIARHSSYVQHRVLSQARVLDMQRSASNHNVNVHSSATIAHLAIAEEQRQVCEV